MGRTERQMKVSTGGYLVLVEGEGTRKVLNVAVER